MTAPGRRDRRRMVLGALGLSLVLAGLLAAGLGAVRIAPIQCLAILGHRAGLVSADTFSTQQEAVFLSIRLPRVLLAMLVGAVLAMAGATMQGLFRNPLSDPALVGVSSGAAVAATLTIILVSDSLEIGPSSVPCPLAVTLGFR